MHVFFSGIGGTAIGPLSLIAKQAGFEVSGSDKQASQYVDYLKEHGVTDIHIGQSSEQIAKLHDKNPIDWFVYSSALPLENPDHPELKFCRDQDIKTSKRDEFINLVLQEKNLKLIAVAGTHGKTTTTAMAIWLLKQLDIPVSYSVGAKISFGEMGEYQKDSEYFVYECDEFDRNFLAFEPHVALVTGVSWDHHEIFPTREDYQQAFKEFIEQSESAVLWPEDRDYLELQNLPQEWILTTRPSRKTIPLYGEYNRRDAWLVAMGLHKTILSGYESGKLLDFLARFPGLQRRMEEITPGLYSDYAHTPEKIRGAMSVALEMAEEKEKDLVVVYEPLTNRRQHYIIDDYKDCFGGAKKVYWIPSYLAREDPDQRIIPPEELVSHLSDSSVAEPRERDESLAKTIDRHLKAGDMVVCMAGGGGDSLDEWIRRRFKQ